MKEDLELTMICFNVCVNGATMCLKACDFQDDDCEVHTSLKKLGDLLAEEMQVTLDVEGVCSINGKKTGFSMITDEDGMLRVVAVSVENTTGTNEDACYEMEYNRNISCYGIRIFAGNKEFIWNAGEFQEVGSFNGEQFYIMMNNL